MESRGSKGAIAAEAFRWEVERQSGRDDCCPQRHGRFPNLSFCQGEVNRGQIYDVEKKIKNIMYNFSLIN